MNITVQSEGVLGNFAVRHASWEGFKIEMIKSLKAPPDGDFLPCEVVHNGASCWSFKKYHHGFSGLAKLVEVEDELVIILCLKHSLHLVLPVRDLPSMQRTDAGEWIGGRKIGEIMKLKTLIASRYGLAPVWNAREVAMHKAVETAVIQKLAEQRAAAPKDDAGERAREAARAQREAKRAQIMGRKVVYAFTSTGIRRKGVPVVGDEWKMLIADTFCVSVTSFDPETGAIGDVVEAFVVLKANSGVERRGVANVTLANPLEAKRVTTKPVKFIPVTIKGEVEEVILAESMDDIRRLRDRGINSGTLAMCPKVDEPGKFSVFRLVGSQIESVTELQRKSAGK